MTNLADDYPEYLEETMGYQWSCWDVVTREQIAQHDAMLASTPDDLATVDLADANDLIRWAYARACKRHALLDRFFEVACELVTSENPHSGIAYDDVLEVLIEQLALAGRTDEADAQLALFRERWPECNCAERLHVFIAIGTAQLPARLAEANAALDDDNERRFEIAQDLATRGEVDLCLQLLEELECGEAPLGALRLDIALLRDELTASPRSY